MANILTHPTNGAIYFGDGTAGSSTVPALTGGAVSLKYDGSAGLNIASYNTTSTDRFSIDGSSGRLFSVNDSLTGTIFSVNDAAGLPIIEVESTSSTDTITMGTYASNALVVAGDKVGIGTATPNASYKLDVVGAIRASTAIHADGDLSATGDLEVFGSATISTIAAATADHDKFLVSHSGLVKYRTGAEVISDIGGVDLTSVQDIGGNKTFSNNVIVSGNLTVNGTTTTINSTTVAVDDKNIELGTVATPTDATADGGGITLKGATDKTIDWVNSTDAWTFSNRVSIPAGSASAPSLTFSTDSDTGFYNRTPGEINATVNGSWIGAWKSNGLLIYSGTGIFNRLGSASAPSYTFSGDTDTGIYRISADSLGITTGGALRAQFNSSGIVSSANVYTAGGSSFRNFSGVWQGTTGATGNGFQFVNSVDGTALTISSTGDTVASGSLTATSLDINGAANISGNLEVGNSWNSSTLSGNSIYVQNSTDGFAFGVGTGVSTWFAWSNIGGQSRMIDVDNDGTYIKLRTANADRVTINSTGATFAGSITTGGTNATVKADRFSGTGTGVVVGPNSNGTVFLRPAGVGSTTSQSSFTGTLATIGTNATFAGSITTGGNVTMGSSGTPKDLLIYGNSSGEFLQYDGSASLLKMYHKSDAAGLEMYVGGGAQPTTHQAKIGRSNSQYLGIRVDDTVAYIVHRQDETDATVAYTRNEIWSSSTGEKAWRWYVANNAGGSASEKMEINSSSELTLGGGTNTITNAKVGLWDTAYADRNKWDGGSTGLTASTGRTSLELGSAATQNTSAFAAASHTHTKLSGFSHQVEYDLIRAGNSNGLYMKARWDGSTTNRYWDMGYVDGNGTFSSGLKVFNNGNITYKGNEMWHAGNDGSGSGLDADKLDGYHATAFQGAITAPNAPASVTTTIVGETIDVTFAASTTSNIDAYLVYSSIAGSDYGLISVVPPDDFSASMSVIDNSFDETGTQAYRVYAMKLGKLSSAASDSISYTVSSAEPTTMSVVNLNNAYYVQWDPPSSNSRFVTVYNVYKHEHATQASLSRASASLVYSGTNTNYMYQINGTNNNNFHQFWVETTIA